MLYDFINIYSGSINSRAEKIFNTVVESITRSYKKRDMPIKKILKSVEKYLSNFDYSPAKKKRKISATINNLDKARNRYKGKYSNEFINNYFIFSNAHFLLNGYNSFTAAGYIALAAGIWILDELYYKDELSDIYEFLPDPDLEVMFKLIPWVVHPIYKLDLIHAIVQLIFCRDLKEYTDLERNDIGLIFDSAFERNKDKNKYEPKQNFESVLKLLDPEHIDRAVEKYESKVWEFYDIAFEIFNLFDKEADRLESEIDKLEDNLFNPFNKNILEMPKLTDLRRNPVDINRDPVNYKQFTLEEELDNLKEVDMIAHISDANGREGFINSYSFIPKKLREKLVNFKVDDPFEMSFALLYLLNENSDIPWLYYGSISLLYTIMDALPYDTKMDKLAVERQYLDKLNPLLYDFKFGKIELRHPADLDSYSKKRKNSINLSQILYYNSYSLVPRVSYEIPGIEDIDLENKINHKELLDVLLYTLKIRNIPDMDLGTYKLMDDEEEDEEELEKEDAELINSNEEIIKIQNQNKRLKEQKKQLQNALQEEKNKSNRYNIDNKDLKEQNDRFKTELNDLRELIFNLRNDNSDNIPENNDIKFPYHFNKPIISFGGHQTWVSEMKKLLPDVTFYDADVLPKIDNIKNATEIWIQAQYIPHKSYYRIMDNVDKTNTKVHYFISTGAKRCAQQMVEENGNK